MEIQPLETGHKKASIKFGYKTVSLEWLHQNAKNIINFDVEKNHDFEKKNISYQCREYIKTAIIDQIKKITGRKNTPSLYRFHLYGNILPDITKFINQIKMLIL